MEEQKSFFQRNKWWIIVLLVVVLLVGWGVSKYNSFVVLTQEIDGQWAQIDNQLQRRFDLIPNLQASVKGTFAQEQKIFGDITEARTRYASAKTTDEKTAAAIQAEGAFGRLLAIMENYPQLNSIGAVKDFMIQLEGTENRIAVERGKFNEKVKVFNTYVKQFPTNLVAGVFGFAEHAYFEIKEGVEEAPKVDLVN